MSEIFKEFVEGGGGGEEDKAAKGRRRQPLRQGSKRVRTEDTIDVAIGTPVAFLSKAAADKDDVQMLRQKAEQLQRLVESQLDMLQKQEDMIYAQGEQIKDQRKAMAALTGALKELAQDLKETKSEQARFTREAGEIKAKLAKAQTSQGKQSYSAVVGMQQRPAATHPTPPRAQGPAKVRAGEETRTVTVDVTRVKGERNNLNEVKTAIESGLGHYEVTKGITLNFIRPRGENIVELVFNTEAEAQKARQHPRWLQTAMPGARARGETWFPIKCDGVSRYMVLNQETANERTIREGILDEFRKDNSNNNVDCTARKAVWLSKVDSGKATGSLVIWLAKKEAAQYLLASGSVRFGVSAAYCTEFQAREDRGPCYRCNKYGHKQSRCTGRVRCGICSSEHDTRNCSNRDNPKCPACGDAHTIFDRGCPLHPKSNPKLNLKGTPKPAKEPRPVTVEVEMGEANTTTTC